MGRQEIVQHIEAEMQAQSTETGTESVTDGILCQQCGVPITPDDQQQGDYVVHRVPSHGDAEMQSVFYCGPSCFQDSMNELFDV